MIDDRTIPNDAGSAPGSQHSDWSALITAVNNVEAATHPFYPPPQEDFGLYVPPRHNIQNGYVVFDDHYGNTGGHNIPAQATSTPYYQSAYGMQTQAARPSVALPAGTTGSTIGIEDVLGKVQPYVKPETLSKLRELLTRQPQLVERLTSRLRTCRSFACIFLVVEVLRTAYNIWRDQQTGQLADEIERQNPAPAGQSLPGERGSTYPRVTPFPTSHDVPQVVDWTQPADACFPTTTTCMPVDPCVVEFVREFRKVMGHVDVLAFVKLVLMIQAKAPAFAQAVSQAQTLNPLKPEK